MRNRLFITVLIAVMLFTTAAFAQTSQTLTLKSGFNFVSFTTSLSLTPTQFKSLSTSIEDIYLFSAAAGSFLSVKDGTLTSLAAGKGYIVKNSSASEISVTIPGGVISAIGSITLKAGFNLVGFSKVPASITFKTIMETYSLIKGIYKWSPAAGGFIQVVRSNEGVVTLLDGADPTFKAGESYFFNLTGDTTINYDGTSIVVGATPVNPNAAPAVIGGTINSAAGMAELGLSYQAAGEEFDVTLTDYDGNAIPSISLEAGETNPKVVKDGQAYSFKTKDFTKSYKIIAKGKTTTNKMLSTFVGKVKENETVQQRDVTPIATAMSMIYADPNKDASTYKQEEQTKKQDQTFMKKLAPVVADLETKRSSSLANVDFSNPAKLEQAYKDAILGSSNPQEIAKIKDGLDAVIGKLEEQLSVLEKLKDALTLVATSGRRQNETYVKESKTKIKSILTAEATDPLKDTTNKQIYKEAKISYGLVCCDLGDIFKNNLSSMTATGAPNMMAAYQALDGGIDPKAKAEYEEGYNMVKNLIFDETDRQKGLDDAGNAALLKNASELAKNDPAKLDEAKKKADVLMSEMENDGKFEITLPTGETLPKDKILEEKGEALINGGRPTEAVDVFEKVGEPRVKNFGLGRAYLQLNDIEFAYKNLKDSVKDIAKSSKGFESRMNLEAQFGKINEALFAFAAVLDKLKNGTETDVMQIKAKIRAEEQLEGSADQILDDPNVTLGKLIKDIKPTTSFFEIGKKFADGQTGFGGQFVELNQETDTLKKAFQSASKLMFKANQYIDKARNAATEADRKKLIHEGRTAGTLDAPAADTAFKYLLDAEAAFKAIFDNAAVTGPMKGDAHYHLGLAFMAHYRGYKVLNIENKELLSKAKEVFLNIQSSIYDPEYAHLQFAITQMIKTMENFENEAAGVVVEDNSIYKTAEKILERAESLYFDGQSTVATTEFDRAFAKFDESYKSTDTKITAKMKEAALYYSGYCLFYKFKLMSMPDETVKVKVMERLKLFKLKFPNSEFANAAGDMINDVTSNVSTLGPVDATMAKPGPEFSKAVSLMEKLRLFYRNNYSTTEIETAFNQAKFIFETVAVQLTSDVKYIGTFSDPKFAAALKDFRAHAKFMLAILYMERFVMPVAKEVKYKNLALQYFNELVMNDYTQPFIPDVKNFISQLKEEVTMEFAEGQPIFTDMFLNQHVFAVDAVKAGTAQLTMTIGVVIPDAAAGVTVSSVKAELKKFGNTVFDDAGAAMKGLALTKVATTVAGAPEKWELKLTLPKNLEIAPYDFKLVALTSGSKSAEAFVPFVVEGQATYARIKNVMVAPNGTSNVFTVSVSHAPEASFVDAEGKYTDVYVSVMVPQYGYLMQSMDYSQDIKLTRATATGLDFTLDIAKELPNLKQGSYVFMFKLINYNTADPVNSFSMPVDVRPFDFFVQSTVAGADNQIVLNAYNKVLANFNGTDTAANKVAAFEKMCDSALPTEMKTALTTAFSSVTNLKFTLVGEPFVQYTNNFNGENLVAVFAPWKLSGTYSKDVLNGVILPDGKMLLPPGKTGAQIMDFKIDGNFEFAKRYSNGVETWLISMGGADNAAPVTTEKPTLTSFAGVTIPAAGGQVAVPSLTNIPFVKVAGQNLKSYEPDVKRVLRILGPNLNMPVILSDSGSYEWMSDSISFSSEKLKGLKGLYNLEMLDSKYGVLAAVPLNFTDSGTTVVSAILFQITSGQNSSQPFNMVRPFEVDRNSDLILKGDKLKPAAGTYSLRYYNMMAAGTTTPSGSMATMFISFAVSTDAGWTNTMITVPKAMLPSSSVLTDGMPTSIVVWDDTKNMPASSQVPVVFLSQLIDPNAGAQAVINTVNGYDAKSTVMIDKKTTDTTGNIDVVGSGFMSVTSRHLDLVLQINGRPVHIPIAYSTPMTAAGTTSPTAANWSDGYIKGTINYNMPIPVMDPTMPAGEMLGTAVTKYPCGLVIWDDQLQKQVTPFMVAIKFMATTTTTPIITSVNGMPFNGTPIELYAEATEIKVEGQNFGEQSSVGTKGLYLRSQPTPMNPMPVTTFLAVMSWNTTMISATMPAAMQGGVYELFIGDMQTAATGSTAYNPAGGVINISKIVLVNLKSTSTTTTATAFINNINGTSVASAVTIPEGVKSLNITGKGFKSTFGTNRMLYMKLKGTNDWKYLADSYMATWTDTSILVNLYDQPVGAFEMFIAETDFGASIISNIVYVNFGQSTTGPNITSINGITITPGMMVTLKSDFTSLAIMGTNFGDNLDKNLIVRFVPYPDPMNPNPAPFEFPTTSWTSTNVMVGRPTLAAGVTLMKGSLEMFNKTLNKIVTMPVPVDFTSTTASTIPAVFGLKYDSVMKKLMWNPATSATSSMMYAYIVNVDGMVYEVPMGVYDFPVNTLMDGEHKAMVQARVPNTYPAQVGPLSTPITFTTAGGATSSIPKVVGLTYDMAMKVVRWTPVQTATPDGFMQYYVYMVEIDGTVIPNSMTMAEFYVMNLTSGTHKIRVQAQLPGSYPPVSGPFSDAYTFTVEDGTGTVIPAVTGITYDAAMNKLKWNPVTSTTAAMPFSYNVNIDNASFFFGPLFTNEFMIPPMVPAGAHNVMVQAVMETAPPQMGAWSAPFSFTSTASTTGSLQAPVITYDAMNKMLSWMPVPSPDANSMVEYKILVNGIEKMMWAQTSIYLGNTMLGIDFTVNNVITVKAVVYYLNLVSADSNAVNTLGSGTTGGSPVAIGTYTGRFNGYNGPPTGTLTINVMAGGMFSVSGYNESKQQSFTSSGTVNANNEVVFDVTFLEVLTYKGIANGSMLDGKFFLKTNPAAVIGSWNAMGSTTTTSDLTSITAMNGEIMANFITAPITAPVMADFVVKQSINGAPEANVMPTGIMPYGTSYKLMIPMIQPTNLAQNIMVSVSYKGGPVKTASYSIPAGTTGGAPNIVTLTYDSTMRKLMWTTDAPATVTGITYFISIDNQTPMPQSMMEAYLPATVMDGAHTAMVWTQVMVNNVPVEGVKKSLNFTVGSATTTSLVFAPAPAVPGTPYSGTSPLTVTITAPGLTGVTIKYVMSATADPMVSGITYPAAGISLSVDGTYTIKAVAVDSTGAVKAGPSAATFVLGAATTATLTAISVPQNGSIDATLSASPVPGPAMADFIVKLNGTLTAINSVSPMGGNIYKLAFPPVMQTATAQTVNVEVTYNNTTKTTSFSVPASTTTVTVPAIDPTTIVYDSVNRKVSWGVPNGLPKPYYVSSCEITNDMGGNLFNGMIPMGSNYMDVPNDGTWLTATSMTVKVKLIVADTLTDLHDPLKSYPGPDTTKTFSPINGGTSNPPAMPTFSPMGGSYALPMNVTISSGTAGAMIKYTLDGSDPMNSTMAAVASPASASIPAAGATLKAVAILSGATSALASAVYTPQGGTTTAPAQPTFTPEFISAPGVAAVSVTITAPAGAMIKYSTASTTNGSEPGMPADPATMAEVASPVTISVPVGTKLAVAAVSVQSGLLSTKADRFYNNYQTATAPAAPTFTPDMISTPGAAAVSVSITAPAGAMVKYSMSMTNDGTEPMTPAAPSTMAAVASPAPVNVPIGAKVRIAAVSSANGMDSTMVEKYYNNYQTGGTTNPPMMPFISPAGPNVTLTDMITITKDPADTMHPSGIIKYTTDGSDPFNSATAQTYSNPFVLTVGMGSNPTIKAVVVDGTMVSQLSSITYTVAGAPKLGRK